MHDDPKVIFDEIIQFLQTIIRNDILSVICKLKTFGNRENEKGKQHVTNSGREKTIIKNHQ